MAWYLVPALVKLRQQLNAAWPNRDKRSDGSIGDPSHSSRLSDHNPDPDGSVDSIDIDVDGIDVQAVLAALQRDQRTSYIIYKYQIWNHQLGWRKYSGSNPHTGHIHVTVRDAYQSQTHNWDLRVGAAVSPPAKPNPAPAPKKKEDEDMRMFRCNQAGDKNFGAVILVSGGKYVPVRSTDYGTYQKDGIPETQVSGPGFQDLVATFK